MPCEALLAVASGAKSSSTMLEAAGLVPAPMLLSLWCGTDPCPKMRRSGSGTTESDAMMTEAAQAREVISFGPFHLVAGERLLTKDDGPVELGGGEPSIS